MEWRLETWLVLTAKENTGQFFATSDMSHDMPFEDKNMQELFNNKETHRKEETIMKKIKIEYTGDQDSALDEKIGAAMESINFFSNGSGYHFPTQTRDISFVESNLESS